jgi:hypothetical protein
MQHLFAAAGNENNLPGKDIDELVPARIPMTLTRPRARRQAKKVDAELRQSGDIAEFVRSRARHGTSKGDG